MATIAAALFVLTHAFVHGDGRLFMPSCTNSPRTSPPTQIRLSARCPNREIDIDGPAFRDICWHSLASPEVRVTACLAPAELDQLANAVAVAQFFTLPTTVEQPPYYVDEPVASVAISVGDQHNKVRAAGLDRAQTLEAIRFRNLCTYLVNVAQLHGSACGERSSSTSQAVNQPLPWCC